jgi:hypothetical protein
MDNFLLAYYKQLLVVIINQKMHDKFMHTIQLEE